MVKTAWSQMSILCMMGKDTNHYTTNIHNSYTTLRGPWKNPRAYRYYKVQCAICFRMWMQR